ncbi:hypothetical protein D3C85_1216920 [compost metagenome]
MEGDTAAKHPAAVPPLAYHDVKELNAIGIAASPQRLVPGFLVHYQKQHTDHRQADRKRTANLPRLAVKTVKQPYAQQERHPNQRRTRLQYKGHCEDR